MTKKIIVALTVSLVLMTAAAAWAQDAAPGAAPGAAAAPAKNADPFFGLDVGVKGGVGGNFLSKPGAPPPDPAPYNDGAGGLGGGAGLYTEFRALWGHLGLEFDVLFEANKNWCNIEYGNVVKADWITRFKTVRIPLLLEGSVENELMRGSLGIGPEFVIARETSTDIEITEGSSDEAQATADQWKSVFSATAKTDTFLCIGVGMAFKVWRLAISLDIRYAYNGSQKKAFDDRGAAEYDLDNNTYAQVVTVGSSSMDLRILLGIAYEAKFGNF